MRAAPPGGAAATSVGSDRDGPNRRHARLETQPLATTPTREFIARLDAITPEQMAVVRREARQAIRAGVIPARSVDLRTTP